MARSFPKTGWEEAGVPYSVEGSDNRVYRGRALDNVGGKQRGGSTPSKKLSRLPSLPRGKDSSRVVSPSSWDIERPESTPPVLSHEGESTYDSEGQSAERPKDSPRERFNGERSQTALSGAITPVVSALAADSPELLPPLSRANAGSSSKKLKKTGSESRSMPPIPTVAEEHSF